MILEIQKEHQKTMQDKKIVVYKNRNYDRKAIKLDF